MKAAALLGLLLLQGVPGNEPPPATPQFMKYERGLSVGAGTGQACAVLDAQVFPHAAPSLADLRIFPTQDGTGREVPYAITLSEAVTEETEPARLLNVGTDSSGKKIVFELEMPARAYTDVTLDLDPAVRNFIATATVEGADELGSYVKVTQLGTFTLFDLASQHLSRDTTLPLQESTFHYLHLVLNVSAAPGGTAPAGAFVPAMVRGAQVPPSREAQILYTTVAETASVATVGRESRATFDVPVRVPVERVSFQLAPGFKANFSRDVRVTATIEPGAKPADGDGRAPLPEVITGNILRVHATETGREIRAEQLGIPAILGSNLQQPAKIEVAIENGDDEPLPISAVRLEMRQRKLCFDVPASGGTGLALFFGDSRLAAPVYDYARLFSASSDALAAGLGPETLNPGYRPRPEEERPFAERHPEVLWIALIAVICVLGMVALKSSRRVGG
jgi:hypothetical protein